TIVARSIVGILIILGVVWWTSSQGSYADDASPVSYFYSNSCSHCRDQKVILLELAGEGFRVKVVDVGDNYERLAEFGVQGTPTFRAANGDELVGFTGKDRLRTWLEEHGAKIK
ncbi:MAG: thioredoxin family protein, partial [Candidatus Micrarchaeota archaeon]